MVLAHFSLVSREPALALCRNLITLVPQSTVNHDEGWPMKYTVFSGYAKKISDEASGIRYAIPLHRKEGLTTAETETFVAKQLLEIAAFDLIAAGSVQRMLRIFRKDNALVADSRMFVRVPEPTVATARAHHS